MNDKEMSMPRWFAWVFCDFWRALGELVMDLIRDPSPGIRFALVSLVIIGMGVAICGF